MKGYAYIGLVMSVLIVAAGAYTVLDPNPSLPFLKENPQVRTLMGVCFALYGCFRFYRSYRMLKGKEDRL